MVLAGRCAADAQGLGTEPPTTGRRRHTDQACDWVVTIDPENKKRNICTSQDPRRCTEKQSRMSVSPTSGAGGAAGVYRISYVLGVATEGGGPRGSRAIGRPHAGGRSSRAVKAL